MASNNLNQKYTIDKYCTKSEVGKAIGVNLIGPFWSDIAEFRKNIAVDLPLADTNGQKFSLTFVQSVQEKARLIDEQMSNYKMSFPKLGNNTMAMYTFSREMLKASLKAVALSNNIDVSDITLTNIVENKEVDSIYEPLKNYFNALKELERNPNDEIDENFLGKYIEILNGGELITFFRNSDHETASSKSLIDREYDDGVPCRLIPDLTFALLDFINSENYSLLSKITSIYYMVHYIKPIQKFNFELASILVKRVIAGNISSGASIYLPMEEIINSESFYGSTLKEVMKTNDFTYAYLDGFEVFTKAIESSLDKIVQLHAHELDVEAKLGDDPKKVEEEFGVIIEKPKVEQPKIVETKKQIQARLEKTVVSVEPSLSEKELKEKMNDILESDPYIKKGQAHFYVHHCTPGKYYTIQQYIKFEGCVYETGRTSMDNLAMQGYYRREQIKNKFVYTPINKE